MINGYFVHQTAKRLNIVCSRVVMFYVVMLLLYQCCMLVFLKLKYRFQLKKQQSNFSFLVIDFKR